MQERNDFQKRIGVGERQHRFGRLAGQSRDLMVLDERTGEVGGKHTEHWDGRQDATVFAPTTAVTSTTTEFRS